MAHFAKVENGLVVQVIVAEQDFISTGALGDPASWIQTSYNTRGNDVFVAPQPSADHILDTDTWTWWNPTATDPVETKPVKPAIPVPVVVPVVAPVVEAIVAPVVVETPVEEVAPVAEETPAEAVVEEPLVTPTEEANNETNR